MPPSLTHLFDSYLVRMKFSIFLHTVRSGTFLESLAPTLQLVHAQQQASIPSI